MIQRFFPSPRRFNIDLQIGNRGLLPPEITKAQRPQSAVAGIADLRVRGC